MFSDRFPTFQHANQERNLSQPELFLFDFGWEGLRTPFEPRAEQDADTDNEDALYDGRSTAVLAVLSFPLVSWGVGAALQKQSHLGSGPAHTGGHQRSAPDVIGGIHKCARSAVSYAREEGHSEIAALLQKRAWNHTSRQ
jgi:hypothetical protein